MSTIPSQVYSPLGSVVVEQCFLKADTFGEFHTGSRHILLEKTLSEEQKLQVLFHEVVHLALYDSGVSHALSSKQEEQVCDALGTYLAASVKAGALTIRSTE